MLLYHQHFFSLVQPAMLVWHLQLMHHVVLIPAPPLPPPQSPFARKRLLDACMHTGRILLYQVIMTRLKNLYSDAPGGLMLSLLI